MTIESLTIYLADDDSDDSSLFTEAILEFAPKTKIKTFTNGVDLMASLLESNSPLPDMIFLDLNMPMMSGEECLMDIKNEARLAEIPVLIYSSYYDDEKIHLLLKMGAKRYLVKPPTYIKLQELLQTGIESVIYDIKPEDFLLA